MDELLPRDNGRLHLPAKILQSKIRAASQTGIPDSGECTMFFKHELKYEREKVSVYLC